MIKNLMLSLFLLSMLTVPVCADVYNWTGAVDNDAFNESNWELDGSPGTNIPQIDPGVAINQDLVISSGTPDIGGGPFQLGEDLGSLTLKGDAGLTTASTGGIRAQEGTGTFIKTIVQASGTSQTTAQFILDIDLTITDSASFTFKGGGNPVNRSVINIAGMNVTINFPAETVTAFINEHLSKTMVNGVAAEVGDDPEVLEPGDNLLVVSDGASGSIVTANPDAFTSAELVAPVNGANREPLVVDLEWSAPGSHTPTDYKIYFRANDPNFDDTVNTNIIDGESVTPATPTTTFTTPELDFDTEYFWRVDNTDGTTWFTGNAWSFTTVPEVPEVTVDPVSQTVELGSEVTFTIEQLRADSIQWYKNGVAISGATEESYVIPNAQLEDEALYHCEVYNSVAPFPDAAADAISTEAMLMIRRQISYWSFDDTLADDLNGFDGVYTDPNTANNVAGDEVYDDESISGKSLMLVGDDGLHVRVTGSEEVFNFYPQGYTVSAWVKTTQTGFGAAIAKQALNKSQGFILTHNGANAIHGLRGSASVVQAAEINDDMWHQIICTYEPGEMKMTLFADGMEIDSLIRTSAPGSNDEPLIFGAELTDGTIGYEGLLDEVSIWTYARDPYVIANEYVAIMTTDQICVDQVGLAFDVAGGPEDAEGNPTGDCVVNLLDFAVFAADWLNCNRVAGADSGAIDCQ